MKHTLLFSMTTASLLMGSPMEVLENRVKIQEENINLLKNKLENLESYKKKKNPSSSFAQKAFVPDISLIGDFSYVSRTKEIDSLNMVGLTEAHSEDAHGHSHGGLNAEEGFNLNYAELVLESTVDPYVDMTAIFHLAEDSFEIEELFVKSRGLPYGLGLKVGKFFSRFGRLNIQHHHVWNFSDQPLIYKALLGEHGLNETGLAFDWTAPTDFYLNFGLEVLKGSNEQSFGSSEIALNKRVSISKVDVPNLKVLYAKLGTDIGDVALLGGLSYAQGESRVNHLSDDASHAFSGDSKLYGVDLTLKQPLGAYSDITWTTEYLKRALDGRQYIPNGIKSDWKNKMLLTKEQSGLYSSLIYKMDNDWKIGLRYDDILTNDVFLDGINRDYSDDMNRYSAMVEYSLSEFNKVRLQYNHDNSMFNEAGKKVKNDEIILQVNLSIGSHGAHAF